jgi:transcription initiation factor IIF auxiliary subunit
MALYIEQSSEYAGDDYWHWAVWLEGSNQELDDVQSVTYILHPTFRRPVRTVDSRETKFRLETAGWGIFTLYGNALRKDGTTVKLEHHLVLQYPDGTPTTA